jgi:hypothetical protein
MTYYAINDETALTAPADADTIPIHDNSAGKQYKLALDYLRMYVNSGVVDCTAATLAVTAAAHAGRTVTLNRAGGIAVTLPAATGTGHKYTFVVGTTFTTAGTIKVTGDDTMTGNAILAQDSADTAVMFEAGATADTITMDGSTTGGLKGQVVELIDIAADLWSVRTTSAATGTEATPFSATV